MADLIRSEMAENGVSWGRYFGIFDFNAPHCPAVHYKGQKDVWGGDTRYFMHVAGDYYICVCWGSFDRYAVPSVKISKNPDGSTSMTFAKTLDREYFGWMRLLYKDYGNVVLQHICDIYNMMCWRKPDICSDIIEYINKICLTYNRCQNDMDRAKFVFMHEYYGMYAEDMKANAHIGRLIKLLAIFDILVSGMPVDKACDRLCAAIDSGVNWRVLRDEAYYKYNLVRPETDYTDADYYQELAASGRILLL